MATAAEFVRIPITEEMKVRAWHEAMVLERKYGPQRRDSRYIGKRRGEQRYEGRIGELAFLSFLDRARIWHREHPPTDRGGDAFDVLVEGARVDVKTSRLDRGAEQIDPRRYGFVIAREQLQKDVDFYVAVYLTGMRRTAWIAGFVRREDVTVRQPVQTGRMVHPAVWIPLERMHSIFGLPAAARRLSRIVAVSNISP